MNRTHTPALARALALALLFGSAACSNYDGTERWEGVYKPESEIDRPKGLPMAMDAGRPDGGGDGAVAADGATAGDAAAVDAGAASDAAGGDAAASDAANGDAMSGDASSDAAPADATPAG